MNYPLQVFRPPFQHQVLGGVIGGNPDQALQIPTTATGEPSLRGDSEKSAIDAPEILKICALKMKEGGIVPEQRTNVHSVLHQRKVYATASQKHEIVTRALEQKATSRKLKNSIVKKKSSQHVVGL